jgi:hypothetical protein
MGPSADPEAKPTAHKRFIDRHATELVIGGMGIAATFLVWWLSLAKPEPRYRVSRVEVAARTETPRLGVTWDGQPIKNLCVCRIALWNHGNLPIRSTDLTSSDPLRIVPSRPVRILAVEPANVSRRTLQIERTLSADGSYVGLNIAGSDALERGDGAAFRLLFTGDCSAGLRVTGRVVGNSDGFQAISGRKTDWVLLLAYALFLIMCFLEAGLIWRTARRDRIYTQERSLRLAESNERLRQVIEESNRVMEGGLDKIKLVSVPPLTIPVIEDPPGTWKSLLPSLGAAFALASLGTVAAARMFAQITSSLPSWFDF